VSRLAVAWTLANPAVHTAIVGTRNPAHVHDAVAAADLDLGTEVLERIDSILTSAVPTAGPTPDSV
jgi:aryl-alcohol dehydrogenase-like predicted oxidoreductase